MVHIIVVDGESGLHFFSASHHPAPSMFLYASTRQVEQETIWNDRELISSGDGEFLEFNYNNAS